MGTVSSDKTIGLVDSNGQLAIHIEKAHNNEINSMYFLRNDVLATGDDDGAIKIWDLRNPNKAIYNGSS